MTAQYKNKVYSSKLCLTLRNTRQPNQKSQSLFTFISLKTNPF